MPFFSVIIPLYNKENYISETVQNVLNQSFTDFEIIIIDDGSTDNSFNVLQEIKDGRLNIYQQKNEGVSKARNNGIERANGHYIALLDADDLWKKDHLTSLYNAITLIPLEGIYCTGYEIQLSKNGTLRTAVYNNYKPLKIEIVPNYFECSTINSVIWPSASAFSKALFYDIGMFNINLKASEDLDFFTRAALKYPVVINPQLTMTYLRNSENNLSKGQFNVDSEHFLNSFKDQEKQNKSLNKFLDINRYSFVIRCKQINNKRWKVVKKQINFTNLSLKQRILIHVPGYILKIMKKLHSYLIKNEIYISSFR